ncbi:Rne/Rng family ribonuclease [Aquipuribacter hungaricus]|uniref:Rne/Rng family ribonuclease n=1 Tax=Aquipuribacter hungaricus TaxID=545624 RepID=UPI0036185E3D
MAGQEPSEGDDDEQEGGRTRRGGRSRRRRGGRGRGSASAGTDEGDADSDDGDAPDDADGPDDAGTTGPDAGPAGAPLVDEDVDDEDAPEGDEDEGDETDDDDAGSRSSRRRRRRRRRSGGGEADLVADPDDPPGTVVRIRESRVDEVTKVKGSTRLEAKRQRRRDGRTTSRKRTVITEAEFLTRRESVDRTLLVREGEDRTEIAVLEDGVLVEHHVTRASQQSMIGNVFLGRVQNVLPSMEAAFVDIGRGRNAVLYAGEVNWDAVGLTTGAQRKIEDALKPGDPVLAQVSKDPVGHKGARLTAQVSLPGRYLVYVPGSSMTGISRKLPETERARLKKVLRRVVPEDAGVIVRTAAEGASEAELERDVARLQAQWEDIERKASAVQAPARLYSEPDLAIKIVRDVFNEDFTRLVVSGDETWETLDGYVRHVAPDLAGRMSRWAPEEGAEQDLFVSHRIDEQIAKGLDRKVWLPSGGSLVIDRTEAMTVVDVNTGKYTGNGGNLEETVTRNNLEAAEEIVRQLRLRDIGGIIVVDFIDMVLESNRNLVLRRLVECLGRDRTKHQVAEVTSLGLVQLTRKRVGSGLLESFSTVCEHCQGRGLVTHAEPVGAGNELPAGPGDTGGRGPGGGGSGPGGGSGQGGGGGARRRGGRPGA